MKKSRVSNRLIAVLASLCLIFSSVIPATILSVGAADGDYIGSASWEVPEEAVEPGDTFEAFVFLNTDTEIGGIQFDVNYDPSVLTVTNIRFNTPTKVVSDEYGTEVITLGSSSSIDNDLPDNSGTFRALGFNPNAKNVDALNNWRYLTIFFQVAEDCTATETEISLVDVLLGSYDNVNGKVIGNTQHEGPVATINIAQPEPTVPTGSLALQADKTGASMGDKVTVSVLGTSNVPVSGVQYEFSYDSSKLKYVSSTAGEGFSSTEAKVDEENGLVRNMLVGINNTPELTESNLNNTVLATYTFEVISRDEGTSPFNFTAAETKMGWYNEEGMEEYVTLTATDGASVTITDANVPVTGIALNEDVLDFSMDKADNQTATLVVTETPEDNTQDLTYTWKSDDTSVATVDEDGVVTAVGAGSTTITVTASNGMEASAKVYVSDIEFTAPAEVVDGAVSVDITDNTLQFTAKETGAASTPVTFSWDTSDKAVATVDNNGLVTLLKSGEVTITVTASNGVSYSWDLDATVTAQLKEVSLNADQVQLSMNDQNKKTADLDVTYTPEKPTDVDSVEWTSSDNAVATVDDDGIVTAVKGGKATITVTVTNEDGEKFTDTAEIYVSELSFELDGQSLDVQGTAGTTLGALAVTDTGEDITPVTYTYTSSNPDVMSVNADGEITLVSNGSATITIQASNGVTFTVTYNVRILVPMTGVTLDKTSMDLTPDEGGTTSASLQATIDPSTTTDSIDKIEWTSSDEDVATVVGDTSATVTAVAPGTSTITVTVTNQDGAEFTATATVNVSSVDANTDDSAIEFAGEDNTLDMNDFFVVTGNVSSVTWSSSDETVATVDENGVVTFVGDGEVTITGSYSNGLSFDKTFTVAHDCADYLVHVDRVEPTTEAEGNIEYWYCSFCNKYYADAEGTQEISAEDTVLAKLPAEETPSTPGGDDTTSTPGGTTSEGTTSGGESTTTPQTGDSSNMMLWSSLAVLALLGLGTGVVVLKKKSRSK